MARKEATNPFYVVLLLVGVLFFVTATAYFVMMLRGDRMGRQAQAAQAGGLMQFMDEHGGQVLTGELVLLGVCTAAAIASDGYWSRRQQQIGENR